MEKKPFQKRDQLKPRPELIPPGYVLLMGDVMGYGARKYEEDNWQRCDDPRRYQGAALRHILQFCSGQTYDPESGLHHLGHAGASIAMLWGITVPRIYVTSTTIPRSI